MPKLWYIHHKFADRAVYGCVLFAIQFTPDSVYYTEMDDASAIIRFSFFIQFNNIQAHSPILWTSCIQYLMFNPMLGYITHILSLFWDGFLCIFHKINRIHINCIATKWPTLLSFPQIIHGTQNQITLTRQHTAFTPTNVFERNCFFKHFSKRLINLNMK